MNWILAVPRESTSLFRRGRSAIQASHQVAQNSSTTTLPCNAPQSARAPSGACSSCVNCKGGAGVPLCGSAHTESDPKENAAIETRQRRQTALRLRTRPKFAFTCFPPFFPRRGLRGQNRGVNFSRPGRSRLLLYPYVCVSAVKRTSRQAAHNLLKHLSALLIILELIEARTGRSQQHYISRLRHDVGPVHRILQGFRMYDLDTSNLRFDLGRRRADRVHALHPLPQQVVEHAIVAALVFAAKNQMDARRK